MTHAAVDADYHQGDTIPFQIQVTDNGSPPTLGTPVDISSASEIEFVVAATASGAALLTKTKTGGDITFLTDGTDGIFLVAIDAADTATTLTPGQLHYQATVTIGTIETVIHGTLLLKASPS